MPQVGAASAKGAGSSKPGVNPSTTSMIMKAEPSTPRSSHEQPRSRMGDRGALQRLRIRHSRNVLDALGIVLHRRRAAQDPLRLAAPEDVERVGDTRPGAEAGCRQRYAGAGQSVTDPGFRAPEDRSDRPARQYPLDPHAPSDPLGRAAQSACSDRR